MKTYKTVNDLPKPINELKTKNYIKSLSIEELINIKDRLIFVDSVRNQVIIATDIKFNNENIQITNSQ